MTARRRSWTPRRLGHRRPLVHLRAELVVPSPRTRREARVRHAARLICYFYWISWTVYFFFFMLHSVIPQAYIGEIYIPFLTSFTLNCFVQFM